MIFKELLKIFFFIVLVVLGPFLYGLISLKFNDELAYNALIQDPIVFMYVDNIGENIVNHIIFGVINLLLYFVLFAPSKNESLLKRKKIIIDSKSESKTNPKFKKFIGKNSHLKSNSNSESKKVKKTDRQQIGFRASYDDYLNSEKKGEVNTSESTNPGPNLYREHNKKHWSDFLNKIQNFDSKPLALKYSLQENDLDLNYWYKFIYDQAKNDLNKYNFEEIADKYNWIDNKNDNAYFILSDNIFAHSSEYINKYFYESIDFKETFTSMRIISFGLILDYLIELNSKVLNNDFNNCKDIFKYPGLFDYDQSVSDNINYENLMRLNIIHAQARLYGAIKFATVSGFNNEKIKKWYPKFIYDKEFIQGTNGLERGLMEIVNDITKSKNNEYANKMKIIYDGKKRFEIYELDGNYIKKIPKWFKGPFYKNGGKVKSVLTNGEYKLDALEKSIFVEIQLSTLLLEETSKVLKSADEVKRNPFLNNLVNIVDMGNLWFENNNKVAFERLCN